MLRLVQDKVRTHCIHACGVCMHARGRVGGRARVCAYSCVYISTSACMIAYVL